MPNCSKHLKTTFNDSLVSEKRAYGILRSLHSHAKWPWHVFTRGVFGNRLPSVLSDEFAISIQDDETWNALDFEGLVQLRQGLLGPVVGVWLSGMSGMSGMGQNICSLALKSTANHGCSLKYSLKESSSLSPVTKTTSKPFAFKSFQELWDSVSNWPGLRGRVLHCRMRFQKAKDLPKHPQNRSTKTGHNSNKKQLPPATRVSFSYHSANLGVKPRQGGHQWALKYNATAFLPFRAWSAQGGCQKNGKKHG